MNDNTLNILFDSMKAEKYTVNPNVKVRKRILDGLKETYSFVYPKHNLGESYSVENYNKQSYFVFKLCEEGYSIEDTVNIMMNMRNTPSKQVVFYNVLHVIREFQKKGILYEKNNKYL